MTRLRLLADDLTGALDTAARFVGLTGPVPVFWPGRWPGRSPPSAAIDSGTREQAGAAAAATTGGLAGFLETARGAIAYLKVDSLLRGHAGQELAACLRVTAARRCVVAPAFPFQGRVTRGGLQHARAGAGWRRVGEDLRATLLAQGMEVRLARPGDAVPEGISLWDAETDGDLRRIADGAMELGAPLLWCGSGGLAGALAGGLAGPPQAAAAAAVTTLDRPVLGLFGSDHPVTVDQLRACGGHSVRLTRVGARDAAAVARRLAGDGVALVGFDPGRGLSRPEAARLIGRGMGLLARRTARPRTLVVAGGETLRSLCVSLGATHLEVSGQVEPGVPRSVMRGGRWDGVEVVSKSGAFGEPGLLRRLIAPGASASERARA
jgi:uncharacterized protein YgbK (DUF1537 family)